MSDHRASADWDYPETDWMNGGDSECKHPNLLSATKVDLCEDCGGWFVYP
jgi:hypothetical protein